MMTPILIQASTIYTPTLFEVFQAEYEKSLAAYIVSSNGTNEFIIAIGAFGGTFTPEEERKVVVNPTSQTVLCSCRLFERIGILCRHALKGLDLLNIKLLPEKIHFEAMDSMCKVRDCPRYAWEEYCGKS